MVGNPEKGIYNSKTGRIELQNALKVGDTLTYEYATGFFQNKMTVTIEISEIKAGTVPAEPAKTGSATAPVCAVVLTAISAGCLIMIRKRTGAK